jgi:predicted O-methyltransferase YrrM
MSLRRKIRNSLKAASRRVFHLGQRLGVDITPRHFYSPVPDIRALRRSTAWRAPRTMAGVAGAADVDAQLQFVRACCPDETRGRVKVEELIAYGTRENGEVGYGPIETAFLYCFVATRRPRRIVQVGAGYSTAIILRAAREAGHRVEVVAIDPFPTDYLRRGGQSGTIRLIAQPAQEVDLGVLTDLGGGDVLFIDSTHAVKPGGEVNRIVLEVLPRLRKGTFVHFHDIFFPYDYHRSVFTELYFPQESTIVHAYLADNPRYTIRASLSMLHYARPRELQALFPEYRPAQNADGLQVSPDGHFPSALYLEVVQ